MSKLQSRKFWTTIITEAMALGLVTMSDSTVQVVAAVAAFAVPIVYVAVQGYVDSTPSKRDDELLALILGMLDEQEEEK